MAISVPRVISRQVSAFAFRHQAQRRDERIKSYRRGVIDGVRPLSRLIFPTVELPLKPLVRGYFWSTVPITWRNRRSGAAKLKIKEMGSR